MAEEWTTMAERLLSSGWGWLFFPFLAIWGATVSYFNKIKKAEKAFKWTDLLVEWFTSVFVVALTIYLCLAMEMSLWWTSFFAGTASFMGMKALQVYEGIVANLRAKP